jgi:hypothetical protein
MAVSKLQITRKMLLYYHYFINGTILSGYVALLCHQEKEELLT